MRQSAPPPARAPIGCLAVLLLALAGALYSYVSGQARLDQYRASPGCFAGSPRSAGLSPCTDETVTVTSKEWSRGRRSSLYELTVDDGSGRRRTVQLVDHGLWYRTDDDDRLTATVWRGDIVALSGRGSSSRTFDNPEMRTGRALEIAVVLGICIVPFLIGLRPRKDRLSHS